MKAEHRKPAVLWVAPNLNSYKLSFLEYLVANESLDIEVFAGSSLEHLGHVTDRHDSPLVVHRNNVSKLRFAFSPTVAFALIRLLRTKRFDLVLFPVEKKHLPLILLVAFIRPFYQFRLVSYNHACLRSSGRQVRWHDRTLTRLLFRIYDHVVFYSEASRQWALDHGLVRDAKSGFANNTLDTKRIQESCPFRVNRNRPITILFLGRLVPSKRVDLLLTFFRELKSRLAGDLQLTIIGDGPDATVVKQACDEDSRITWLGALADEAKIQEQMQRSHLVFVPGSSGLSIVHAFCYGKPYVTLRGHEFTHGPEFAYLTDEVNGLVLDGDQQDRSLARVIDLVNSDARYASMCEAAHEMAKGLSLQRWADCMAAELRIAAGV